MHPRLALLGLVGACACWSLSFPLMKALSLDHAARWPGDGTWFIAAWSLCVRFALSAALLALGLAVWRGRGQLRFARGEWIQGLALGAFTAGGMLLQMDGLNYTQASTSAFLTQAYAVQIPILIALRQRRLPHPLIWLGVGLVVAGSGVLAGVDPRDLRLGRGEWETLAAATLFTGQILVAGSRRFAGNRPFPMSVIALAATAAFLLPLALATAPAPAALASIAADGAVIAVMAVLTLVCTLAGMLLMFACQRRISPVIGGVTYCCEPIFASLAAMVLPGVLSAALGIAYADEALTANLMIGGSLVVAAVIAVQFAPDRRG